MTQSLFSLEDKTAPPPPIVLHGLPDIDVGVAEDDDEE